MLMSSASNDASKDTNDTDDDSSKNTSASPYRLEGKSFRHSWSMATPCLHNKIPALKIFTRGWVAQEPICYTINAKIFQGLGPKRRQSCNGDRV